MNFCVLKFEENMQHFCHIVLYYFKKGKNTTETQQKICAVYGEGAVTNQMCQKGFSTFHAGYFWQDDAAWLGRAVEVDSDHIDILIENNQLCTKQEIANIPKISKSIKLLVKMKNMCFILWKKTKWTFWPTE